MTNSPTNAGSDEFRTKLVGQFGIRWTPQREQEAADLERRGTADPDATDVLNGETHFFRFPFYLDVLRSHAIQRQDGSHPYRVHSAACSSGEEAYSSAFVLLGGRGDEALDVEVSGSDARRSAIEIGARALYGKWSLRGVSPTDQAAFLIPEAGRYRVKEPYRSNVQFFVKNLLEPYEHRYDAIFLCNATLYMTESAAQHAYLMASAALRPHGLLFVAPTDPVPSIPELARCVEYKGWPIFGRADGMAAREARKPLDPDPPGPRPAPIARRPVPEAIRPQARKDLPPTPERVPAPTARPAAPLLTGSEDSIAVLKAWSKGDLESIEAPLRRLVFLAPDHPLWRFLTGCLQWERGWLRRAHKELETAALLSSALPDDQIVEGVCSAKDLRRLIDYWKGDAG